MTSIWTGLITGLGLLLLLAAATGGRRDILRERLADDDQAAAALQLGEGWEGLSIRHRLFAPIARAMAAAVSKIIPAGQMRAIDQQLTNLGNPWGLEGSTFVSLLIAAGVGGLILGILIDVGAGLDDPLRLFCPFGFGLAGVMYPRIKLQRLEKTRRKEMAKALPDTLDLLTICVEAGLAIDAAIREVAFSYDNALSLEFRRLINEMNLGRPRDEALTGMAERSGIEELSSLAGAIIQSQKLGAGLGATLRVQSEEARRGRRQKAEETAAKAPLKMLFPMVGCIFPALFLVLLGPAVVMIANNH